MSKSPQSQLPDYAVLALAAWRLTRLISSEDGPWDMLARFRYMLGVRYDEYSVAYGTNVVSKAVLCVWCFSMWVAAALSVAYWISPKLTRAFCVPFALSAATIIVEESLPIKNDYN